MNRARLSGEAELMNGSADFLGRQGDDHPLDLPPVAEAHDIAGVAAALGANGRLQAGIVAEQVDQLGCVGKRRPAGDEWRVHGKALSPLAIAGLPTSIVNATVTVMRLIARACCPT